jgi:hypothetical protein
MIVSSALDDLAMWHMAVAALAMIQLVITAGSEATLPAVRWAAHPPLATTAGRRWYQGDFHVHSLHSDDARATIEEDVALAHGRGLDFINLTDHNTIAQHAVIAAAQPHWPVLVLHGSEITTHTGHGGAVGIHAAVDARLGHQGRTMRDIIDDVVAQGGAFIVNHPMLDLGRLCIGCGWKHTEDAPWDQIAGIEVLTGGYGINERLFTPKVIAMWDALEDQGHRLSAVSGSDDHAAGAEADGIVHAAIGSPTAMVLAGELSEAAILDALRHHRTKVKLRGPDDPDVDFSVRTAGGQRADIGDDVEGVSVVEMPVHVGRGHGMFVEVWRDGEQRAKLAVTSDDFTTVAYDSPPAGDHRYRVELTDADGRRVVITSHIYVHTIGGAGCGRNAGDPNGLLPVFAIGLLGFRSRRRPRPAGLTEPGANRPI